MEWISVKDRLPEKNTEVLIAFCKKMYIPNYSQCVGYIDEEDGLWYDGYDEKIEYPIDYIYVYYWMPLPKAPKE